MDGTQSAPAQYDRWLGRRSLSAMAYSLLATVPGALLVNTPAFRLAGELNLSPEHKLLDIGCGRGALLSILSSKVDFRTPPVGVDASAAMLSLARRDLSPGKRIDLARGLASSLPFASRKFDVVVCSYLIKHLSDEELLGFLKELRRILTWGGIAVLWEFAPTASRLLNAWNRKLLTLGVSQCNLRGYRTLSAFALEAGFEWVSNANLRPFLYPPIPRVSLITGRAPMGWSGQASL